MKINMKKVLCGIMAAAVICTSPVPLYAADETGPSSYYENTIDGNEKAAVKASAAGRNNVVLHYSDGSVYKSVKIRNGKMKLPAMANPTGCTFMGWSRKKGKMTAPEYEAGDIISVKKHTDLYPVIFNRSAEPDLSKKDIVNPKGYKHIIFVGDSRTYAMERLLIQEYGSSAFPKVEFVGKPGTTLTWLKTTGKVNLKKILIKNRKNGKYEKTAVIFNHGVNSFKHSGANVNTLIRSYCSYMKELGPVLKKMNCDLYYMSVNPVNTGKRNEATIRKGEEIRQFNKGIRKGLKGMYGFINTYSYLIKNGYGTAVNLKNQENDDGTHYTYKTYKRIFAYCMKYLAKNKG